MPPRIPTSEELGMALIMPGVPYAARAAAAQSLLRRQQPQPQQQPQVPLNTLPPFEPPGTVSAQYMPPMPPADTMMPPVTVTAPRPPPPAPPQPPAPAAATPPPAPSPQGNYGPAWNTAQAYDPNTDPRYLPDQWRGAFSNWQWPG